MQTAYKLLQFEISSTVFPILLRNSAGSGTILQLWQVNPNLLLRGFLDAYNTNPDDIRRVLDVCQELKVNMSCALLSFVN